MTRRAAGVGLLFIAAILFATRYFAAAIYGSSMTTWNADLYNGLLQYVGDLPWQLAGLAAILGIAYLIWAELGERK